LTHSVLCLLRWGWKVTAVTSSQVTKSSRLFW
jgi:hypothetical protein